MDLNKSEIYRVSLKNRIRLSVVFAFNLNYCFRWSQSLVVSESFYTPVNFKYFGYDETSIDTLAKYLIQ